MLAGIAIIGTRTSSTDCIPRCWKQVNIRLKLIPKVQHKKDHLKPMKVKTKIIDLIDGSI